MQKGEFFQKLNENLDFLSDTEKESVLKLYEEKFSDDISPEEEEKRIQEFGDLSDIIENIKADFTKSSTTAKEDSENNSSNVEDNDDFDLIFSRPIPSTKSSEIIHSFENKEMKTLFGEKVVVENRKKPIQEIILEPIDEDNGFTPEEIEHAKEETLEKAIKFNTAALDISKTDDEDDETNVNEKVLIEEETDEASDFITEDPDSNSIVKSGLFTRIFSALHLPKSSFIFLSILFTVIISPVLLSLLGICIVSYALVSAIIILFAVLLFILMIGLIILGVLELVYGFLALFDQVTVALIELGLGTVLFSLVTAIAAVSYEFIFAVTPRVLKKITGFFVSNLKKLIFGIYGGIR